jgi:hypothetical protein
LTFFTLFYENDTCSRWDKATVESKERRALQEGGGGERVGKQGALWGRGYRRTWGYSAL